MTQWCDQWYDQQSTIDNQHTHRKSLSTGQMIFIAFRSSDIISWIFLQCSVQHGKDGYDNNRRTVHRD